MSELSTQLTIKLTDVTCKNTVSISYRPSEVQALNYSTNTKSLDSVLSLGTKTTELHGQKHQLEIEIEKQNLIEMEQ